MFSGNKLQIHVPNRMTCWCYKSQCASSGKALPCLLSLFGTALADQLWEKPALVTAKSGMAESTLLAGLALGGIIFCLWRPERKTMRRDSTSLLQGSKSTWQMSRNSVSQPPWRVSRYYSCSVGETLNPEVTYFYDPRQNCVVVQTSGVSVPSFNISENCWNKLATFL